MTCTCHEYKKDRCRHSAEVSRLSLGLTEVGRYILLDDDVFLMEGDETVCLSTWKSDVEDWVKDIPPHYVGKTVGYVCDAMGDMDGWERLFRRRMTGPVDL